MLFDTINLIERSCHWSIYNRKLFIEMKKMSKEANMKYPTHGDVSIFDISQMN